MKWAGYAVSPVEKLRFEKLAASLTIPNELTILPAQTENDFLKQFSEFKHVRFGESVQPAIAKKLNIHSSWTALLGVTDGMIFRDERWWPLCSTYEAICGTLAGFGKGMDFSSSAFVSGAGAMARAGISALFKCGFRNFKIVAIGSAADELAQEMKVRFFGINIEVIPIDKVVMLAGVCSVFLNTATEDEFPDLAQELSYLNFLKRPGAILDTTLSNKGSVFLKEASDSGIPSVDGWRIAAKADVLWAEWAFGTHLDEEKFLQSLQSNG